MTRANGDDEELVLRLGRAHTVGDLRCLPTEGEGELILGMFGPLCLASDPEGIIARSHGTGSEVRLLLVKYPLRSGADWGHEGVEDGSQIRFRNEGAVRIGVPAGTFTAWKITRELERGDQVVPIISYWFAHGVGFVRTGEGLGVGHGTPLCELVSHRVR